MIPSTTLAEAWLYASEHLLARPEWVDTTIVLHIEDPRRIRRADRAVADTLDAFLVSHANHSHHTVAETIFPGYEYVRRGVAGVLKDYPDEVYPKIKHHPEARRWGTYAHRLLRRVDRDGNEYKPLETLIKKMQQAKPVRAAYELGLGLEFDLSTYDDDVDRSSRLGGPCLSHLSFKLINEHVHLTAVYRSHHYIHRAYGNLLGLARLQSFVADQVGVPTGPLVCHSTMALLEHGKKRGWNKSEVEVVVRACRAARTASEQLELAHVRERQHSPPENNA